jgi:pSer/pThr/pTyr-binding forkhead associated (FHA) protein
MIQTISINFIENLLSKHDSSLLSQATLRRQHQFGQGDAPILIGRTQECRVRFKEGALSRVQCRIDFIDGRWLLRDGNGKDRPSTNGTWLWVSQPHTLMDDDLFKAGNAIFKVNYT